MPESARWLAVSILDRPDLLAENYSLPFQLSVDAEVIARFHVASYLAATVIPRLRQESLLDNDAPVTKPVIVSDRGPLDGVTYSELRCETDTNTVNGSPRTGFLVAWLKDYVNLVVIADHTAIPFEPDAARLPDHAFRLRVAHDIAKNYGAVLSYDQITTVTGSRDERKGQLIRAILATQEVPAASPPPTPYEQWASVTLPSAKI